MKKGRGEKKRTYVKIRAVACRNRGVRGKTEIVKVVQVWRWGVKDKEDKLTLLNPPVLNSDIKKKKSKRKKGSVRKTGYLICCEFGGDRGKEWRDGYIKNTKDASSSKARQGKDFAGIKRPVASGGKNLGNLQK